MKKRILITISAILFIVISYVGFQIIKIEKEKKMLEKTIRVGDFLFVRKDLKQPTKLKNGLWKNATDSLSGFEIENGKLTFLYDGKKIGQNDIYDYEILTEYISELKTQSQSLEHLILRNKSDTLNYLIFDSSDKKVNLSHVPSGKNHVYTTE